MVSCAQCNNSARCGPWTLPARHGTKAGTRGLCATARQLSHHTQRSALTQDNSPAGPSRVRWFPGTSDASTVRSMNEQTARSPFRRPLLMGGVSAAALMFLVLPGMYFALSSSQLDEKLEALRSQGLPTSAEELNAYYSVLPDGADATEQWITATTAVQDAGIGQRAAKIPIVGLGPTPVPDPGNEWAEREISRTFLDGLDAELQLIRRAADAGGMARYPVDYKAGVNADLTAQHQVRVIARLLTLSAHVHAHSGRDSETLQDVTDICSASDSLRSDPGLISQFVRIATHAIGCEMTADMLPHCQWTDDELERLQAALGRADFRQGMLRAFCGERALCLTAFRTSPQILFRYDSALKVLEMYQESTAGLETSWLEATMRNQKIDAELRAMSSGIISRMIQGSLRQMLPALQQAVNAGTRAEARQNCAIVTIAVRRYRLQHGVLPISMTDLRDLIPGDAAEKDARVIDPFDGQSLRFRSADGRVLIYSIGDNKVDDGGAIANEKPQQGDLGYSIADDSE